MIKNENISIETQIDDDEWLAFIQKCPQKEIFQTPYMRNVFNKTKNHKSFSFFARDNNDEIVGSLLAYTVRDKVPLSFFSRRAIVEGGPIFLNNEKGKLAAKLLIDNFSKEMKKHAILAEVRYHRPTTNIDFCFQDIKYNYIEYENILIDLIGGEDAIWKGFHRRKKSKVKQAAKRGVICRRVESESEMKVVYSIVQETHNRVKMPLADESLFTAIFHELTPQNLAYPLLTELKGEIIGGIVPLLFEKVIFGWYMAGLREYSNHYHQNDLIVWELLKWGSKNNYNVFDFGDAGDPNKPSGLRDFKMRFGGKRVKYNIYQRILRPYYFKISKTGYKIWSKYYKGLRRTITLDN
ncbi:MAG: lipid II:glycine glycyltransferase FemX [Promethearchaeota archaeon]